LKEGDSLANGNTLDQIRKNITGGIDIQHSTRPHRG